MNYTNSSTRLQLPAAEKTSVEPGEDTVLSLEVGPRGTFLRLRKATTVSRRKLRPFKLAALAVLAGLTLGTPNPAVANDDNGGRDLTSNTLAGDQPATVLVTAVTGVMLLLAANRLSPRPLHPEAPRC